MTYDTVITDSHIILPQGIIDKNILIDEGKIVGFTNDTPTCDNKINGNGLISVPGPIDTHVHYGVFSPINEDRKIMNFLRTHYNYLQKLSVPA